MQEKTKDIIEAVESWGFESALALIPGVGTSLALASAKILAVAEARRVQKQITELSQLLQNAIDDGLVGLQALESDAFLANLHFVVRQLQETNDAEKRDRLKRALVAGATRRWKDNGERFTRIIARIEEPHIEALGALDEISGTSKMGVGTRQTRVLNGTVKVMRRLSAAGKQRPEGYYRILFEQLSAEGLVVINGEAEILDQITGEVIMQEKKASLKQGMSLKITGTGSHFIHFLKEPLDASPHPESTTHT